MSRENRRKAAASGGTGLLDAPRPAPPAPPPARREDEARPGSISWRHCLVGLLVGEVILLLLSDGGLALANFAFGSDGRDKLDGGIVGVATFLAVLTGAYIAARLARRMELYQGTVVAIGFIVVGALYQFGQEASAVHSSLSSGTHTLIDLGPMNLGGVVSGDLLALVSGSIGALLARRRSSV
jgi:hypothetical protein